MDTNYFYFDEKNKQTQQLSKEEYRSLHDENFSKAQSQEDKNLASQDYFYGIRAKTNAILPQKLEMEYAAGKFRIVHVNEKQFAVSFDNPLSYIKNDHQRS